MVFGAKSTLPRSREGRPAVRRWGVRLSILVAFVVAPLELHVTMANAAAPTSNQGATAAVEARSPERKPPVTAAAPVSGASAPADKANLWPRLTPQQQQAAETKNEWPREMIEAERARCEKLIAGTGIVALPADPVRQGECGAPAPYELISVGTAPQVSFSPPVTVTCDMAIGLDRWIKEMQPLARRLLKAEVAQVITMSSYSCRNAYGRTSTRLSEHGKANAVDIRGFMTVRGHVSAVLTDWGMTRRDVEAQVALAKAATQKAEAEKARLNAAKSQGNAQKQVLGSDAGHGGMTAPAKAAINSDSNAIGASGIGLVTGSTTSGASSSNGEQARPEVGFAPYVRPNQRPNRLGGPIPPMRPQSAAAFASAPVEAVRPGRQQNPDSDGAMQFHRAVHASACRIFGTTLGPEANEAHRDHYHVDMAARRNGNYCR